MSKTLKFLLVLSLPIFLFGCGNKEQTLEELSELQLEAINTLNPEVCEKIYDKVQYIACKYNVYANQAIKYEDPTICQKIGDEENIKLCLDNF